MISSGRAAAETRELDETRAMDLALAVRRACRDPPARLRDATEGPVRFAALLATFDVTRPLRAAGSATLLRADTAGAVRSGAAGAAVSTELLAGVSGLATGFSGDG